MGTRACCPREPERGIPAKGFPRGFCQGGGARPGRWRRAFRKARARSCVRRARAARSGHRRREIGMVSAAPDSICTHADLAASAHPAIFLAGCAETGHGVMLVVNVGQAKTQLSRLLARVEAGEDVIIARRGEPVARLVGCRTRASGRRTSSGAGSSFRRVSSTRCRRRDSAHGKAASGAGAARHPCARPVFRIRRVYSDCTASLIWSGSGVGQWRMDRPSSSLDGNKRENSNRSFEFSCLHAIVPPCFTCLVRGSWRPFEPGSAARPSRRFSVPASAARRRWPDH